MDKELFQKIETFQNLLVDISTGGESQADYQTIRSELLSNSLIKDVLPSFLATNRTPAQFWQFIKGKFPTYAERRTFLWDSFSKALVIAEKIVTNPGQTLISEQIVKVDNSYIQFEWDKALKRISSDPEGAITSARALIETVCKHILDKLTITYADDLELPKLYQLVAKQLHLAPEQHLEPIFKQILGGCQSVVNGLGAIRNKLSDSHGKKITSKKPKARHAELCVNLAGSMSIFLLESYNNRL
jgi:hypothetical protein